MRVKLAVAAVLVVSIGLLATPAGARPSGTWWFRGVQVMPGGVVRDGRIIYDHGNVVVIPAVTDGFDTCLSGYVCLFADINWGGDIVQFTTCCAWNNLSDYGFNNTASSWRNRKAVDAQIAMGTDGGGSKLCLNNNDYASSMPSGWDNGVSSIRIRDAGTYC